MMHVHAHSVEIDGPPVALQPRRLVAWIVLCCGCCLPDLVLASDEAKEQRWAEQIVDSLLDGEAHYLEVEGHEFLTIHTQPETKASRAVIVMHGTGVHPDWQTVIYPLRVGLVERGFHTLSVQMPILANDAEQRDYIVLFDEVAPRIDAALAYLRSLAVDEVYLIGHSLGALMGAHYLREPGSDAVKGFVAIGLGSGIANTAMDSLAHLSRISVPMLDLYGSDDLDDVVNGAGSRRDAAAPNSAYEQHRAQGADHFFEGEEEELLSVIQAWLDGSSNN